MSLIDSQPNSYVESIFLKEHILHLTNIHNTTALLGPVWLYNFTKLTVDGVTLRC